MSTLRRFFSGQIILGFILIFLSTVFYCIHYFIFRDAHHIFLYLIGDIAFLFIDVLIVMLVLHRLLEYREKKSILRKLNMVIGTFFSEVGIELMRQCAQIDANIRAVSKELVVTREWSHRDFLRVQRIVCDYRARFLATSKDLCQIKDFLVRKRGFLLVLLENPNLLEHESFTNLLWAVFHLTDELVQRKDVSNLYAQDRQHLLGDIERVYHQILGQWLDYMRHLKNDYPYLFSLAMRTNPFDGNASVEVKEV